MKTIPYSLITFRYPARYAVLLLSLLSLLESGSASAQIIFQDSFSYSAGTALASQGGWIGSSKGTPIQISPGSLSMPGFAASSGNSVALIPNSAGSGVEHSFASQSGSYTQLGNNIYMSYILNVSSLGSLNTQGTVISGFTEPSGQQVGNLWLRADNLGFDIGGSVDSTTPVDWNSPNTGNGWSLGTYLIVEQIQFPRADNTADAFDAYITPYGSILSNWGGVAGPSAIQNSDPTAPIATVDGVFFSDGSNSPNATVDELRVGPSWADVTPVAVPEPSTVGLLALGILFSLLVQGKLARLRLSR